MVGTAVILAIFIPIIFGPSPKIGICIPSDHHFLGDVSLVGASWWYDWTPQGNVPMSFNGNDPGLPSDYSGYLLVFNEPESPYQANLSPLQAAVHYEILTDLYPKAKFIIGGTGYGGREWLGQFYMLLIQRQSKLPTGWHIHAYIESWITLSDLQEWATWAHYTLGGELWLTEVSNTYGDLPTTQKFLEWLNQTSWITRYAWFANRIDGTEWYIPKYWEKPLEMALVAPDGRLTPTGQLFKNFP